MPARNPKVDVRFLVDAAPSRFDREFFTVRLRAVYINDEGKVRNASSSGWGNPNELRLADLVICAQAHERDGDRLYGFNVRYEDAFSIDAERATRMAKTLTMIERKLDAINQAEGYPENIGQYAGRVARALGAQTAVCFGCSDSNVSYDLATFSWFSAHTLTLKVADRMAAWKAGN